MKKLLVLTLCLLICAPATALCDVLADGWDAAPMEELQEAQTALSNRMSELRADKVQEEATEDPINFTGNGTAITDGFTLEPGMWCMATNFKEITYDNRPVVSTYVNDVCNSNSYYRNSVEVINLEQAMSADMMTVETKGEWSISIARLKDGDGISMDGKSPAVGDCFTVSVPTIVTLSATGGDDGFIGISLYTVGNDGRWDYENTLCTNLENGQTNTMDVIVKPDGNTRCFFWLVNCGAGTVWSITTK